MIDLNNRDRKIGKMDERISWYRVTAVSDSQGGYTETTALLATCWANVEPITGNRSLSYGQLYNGQGYLIYQRYNSSVTPKDYILYGSKQLIVHSIVDQLGENRYQTITAFEKV